MDKPETYVSIFTNAATIAAFVLFIVPGFISLRAYESQAGGEARKVNDALVDVVVYSFATDLFAIPILLLVWQISIVWLKVVALVIASVIMLGLLPFCIGLKWHQITEDWEQSGFFKDSWLKPWDQIFRQIEREGREVGVILTLPDGRKIGGKYVAPGLSSEYPAEEQLLLGETWLVDQQSGCFLKRIPGSYGLLIDKKDVLTVEFFIWSEVERGLEEYGDDARRYTKNEFIE